MPPGCCRASSSAPRSPGPPRCRYGRRQSKSLCCLAGTHTAGTLPQTRSSWRSAGMRIQGTLGSTRSTRRPRGSLRGRSISATIRQRLKQETHSLRVGETEPMLARCMLPPRTSDVLADGHGAPTRGQSTRHSRGPLHILEVHASPYSHSMFPHTVYTQNDQCNRSITCEP